ncbi:MAG TPA: Crp/Fnr family transcriptional regulator [Bacillota bacterium]|nr:Crp/Fnr family transcriptional regulator [Bacillota bacterium]
MNYILEICKSPLLSGISKTDAETLLACLSAKERVYDKNDFIFSAGQQLDSIGLVVAGRVHIVKEDFWGNRTIIEQFASGDLFAEAFTYARVDTIPFSVMAVERTVILFLDHKKIAKLCPVACKFHNRLVENMLRIIAEKNMRLTQKINHLTKRTTREKLLSFLSEHAIRAASNSFNIPFNRQEMADYLSVDRSAMSNELSKMRDEGMIEFNKNLFELRSQVVK